MKEVKAYVQRSRVADVIQALQACTAWGDVRAARRHNLALYVVKGSLLAAGGDNPHYSVDLGTEVVNEYKLELLCEDAEVDELVAAIRAAARTGQKAAGWVCVTDLVRAEPVL